MHKAQEHKRKADKPLGKVTFCWVDLPFGTRSSPSSDLVQDQPQFEGVFRLSQSRRDMTSQEDVAFKAVDGTVLRGRIYMAENPGPGVVMSPGVSLAEAMLQEIP
jgi:hypothetical protein